VQINMHNANDYKRKVDNIDVYFVINMLIRVDDAGYK
jgi:hypothetical protein